MAPRAILSPHESWDLRRSLGLNQASAWEPIALEHRVDARPRQSDGDPEVPDDIWHPALLVFPEPEASPNNPTSNERRKIPLQFLLRGGVESARGILIEIVPAFLPPEDELRNDSEVELAMAEARAMAPSGDEGEHERR